MILILTACRDDGTEQLLPPAGTVQEGAPVVSSDIRAGRAQEPPPVENPYADDEHALAAGRALYASMNCAGCHGPAGGGGMGPPLADTEWIYGGAPENIVQAILQGRPNGMPAFGAQLPASEAWKIATYVKSLSKAAEARKPSERNPAVGAASPGSGR